MNQLPKVITVVGPTASGKTSLGIALARQFNGEVISVDSRQIYRGMDIGTGKEPGKWKSLLGGPEPTAPSKKEGIEMLFNSGRYLDIEGVLHWGIDLVDPDQGYSVADFKEYAEQKINEIIKRGRLPIFVGGTGMWLQAVIDNLDLTQTPPDSKLRQELDERNTESLFFEYKRLDPKGAETIDQNNKRRLVRALEVTLATGRPFSEQQSHGEVKYEVLQLGIEVDRRVLNDRISNRIDQMVVEGLVDEVRGLYDQYQCDIPAMSGIGYRQICKFFQGQSTLAEAIEEMKKDTRHYAKRQMTWFKRDERIKWVKSKKQAIDLVKRFI
ncbi:tRNA (adenosine(37)-N6)-dimethylallyltransferase MiaA [Patescibacteria group bacterium]